MVSHFHEKKFPRIRRDVITISQFKTEDFVLSLIVFSAFISSASEIFLLYMYGEMRTVFGCSQSNCMFWLKSFLTHQHIFRCTSNLNDILLVDKLLCSFDTEFVVEFFPTWRQYFYFFYFFGLMFGIQGNFFRFL